jgi:hypothetical protein
MRIAGRPHMEFDRWRQNNAVARNLVEIRDKLNCLQTLIHNLEDK